MAGVTTASAAELAAALRESPAAVLVDVRTEAEFAAGHIPGAKNHPVQTLAAVSLDLPEDRPVWVICKSGKRSAMGAKILSQCGLEVIDVQGGMAAWRMSGGAIEQGTPGFPFFPMVLAFTLGLAPFWPRPHLIEKLEMVSGGGLSALDSFDLLFHGAPWIWFAVAVVEYVKQTLEERKPAGSA